MKFQEKDCHSSNFKGIMKWLKAKIKLSNQNDESEVTAELTIKTENQKLMVIAKIENKNCHIKTMNLTSVK